MYFYCKSFPFYFFFLFFDGTMLFFEEMKDKFTKQRSLSAVTPVVVCLDAHVSVTEVWMLVYMHSTATFETVSSLPVMERNVSDNTALIEAFWENC